MFKLTAFALLTLIAASSRAQSNKPEDVMKAEMARGDELVKRFSVGDPTLCPKAGSGDRVACFKSFLAKTDVSSSPLLTSLTVGATKSAIQDKSKYGAKTASLMMIDSILSVEEKFDPRKHILMTGKMSLMTKYFLGVEEKALNDIKAKIEKMVQEKFDSVGNESSKDSDAKTLAWQRQMMVNLSMRLERLKKITWQFPIAAKEITKEELSSDSLYVNEEKTALDRFPRNYCSNPTIARCYKIPVGQCSPAVGQLLNTCHGEGTRGLPSRFPASSLDSVNKKRDEQIKSCFVAGWATLVNKNRWHVPGCKS
jgi:hypothetical protein